MENKNFENKNISIYIHIPFCERKCFYCDFLSFSLENIDDVKISEMKEYEDTVERYFQSLFCEIEKMSKYAAKYTIKSIFIGGGTPTSVSARYITSIINIIKENYDVDKNCEITIEANPNSLTEEKAKAYISIGINRISIGAQSFVNAELVSLGRLHKKNHIENAFSISRKAGFDNISLDLMFDIPHQTDESLKYSISKALWLKPEHISIYSLEIEEGTKFYDDYKNGKIDISDNFILRKKYDTIQHILNSNGYEQYEVSNFSKKGYKCYHNDNYWKYGEYIGLGLGASSYFKGYRFQAPNDFREYELYAKKSFDEIKKSVGVLSKEEEMSIFTFTSLRKSEGVDLSKFKEVFNCDFKEVYKDEIRVIEKEFPGATEFDLSKNSYFIRKEYMVNSSSIMCYFMNLEEDL